MKNYKIMFFSLFGFSICGILTFIVWHSFYAKNNKEQNALFNDSISILNSSIAYYTDIIDFENKYQSFKLSKDILVYRKELDNTNQPSLSLDSILNLHDHNLLLRYTEIGCDQCSDLTLKKLKDLRKLSSVTPIILLVDFTNYDAYLQWRKLSNIDFDVFFVKKGAMPMDEDCPRYSYLLWVSNLEVSSCFIPNSGLPESLNKYLLSLKFK